MKMKAVVCVFLLVLTLVSRASTETDCTEVDPGSSADVCSMLQDKLQSALLQNPTNLDKLRKAFANPIPSIMNIHYDIEWGNVTAEACTEESTNFTLTSHYSSNYLWTNVPFFTTLSPGFLQHLQLQVPYTMIRFAELFFGRVSDDYTLNALLWDGCSDELLLSLSLSLRVDSLPCTPSKQLLESSIQELTSWLQVFAEVHVHPQIEFTFDMDKKHYAIPPHHQSKFSDHTWKIITGITLTALIIIYLPIVGVLLCPIKQYFFEDNKLNEELPYPLIGILVWNILVLAGELYAIITTCYIGLFLFSLKITLFVLPIAYHFTRVCKCIKEKGDKKNKKDLLTIAITNFLIQGNLFLSIEYFTASVVPASLLAYTYPLQVIATIALLSAGLVFSVFLAMFSRKLYKQALEKCPKKIPQIQLSVLRWFIIILFSTITITFGILIMVALLAIFGIAILKGEANLSGPNGLVLAFLPTAVFSVLSWLMHKYKVKGINSKQAEKENATATSALEEGRDKSDMTDHQPTDKNTYDMTDQPTDENKKSDTYEANEKEIIPLCMCVYRYTSDT